MYKVKRLAQAAQLWKDVFFWLKTGVVVSKKVSALPVFQVDGAPEAPFPPIPVNIGPFVHAEGFEESALQKQEFTVEDWSKFTYNATGELTEGPEDVFTRDLNIFPLNLWKWSRGSRRVFHLQEDIQMFLESTGLGDTSWSDITFPFDTFYISLEIPIKGLNCEYDGLLVSLHDPVELQALVGKFADDDLVGLTDEQLSKVSRKMLDITLFPKELGNFRLMGDTLRSNINKLNKGKDVIRLYNLFLRYIDRGFTRPFLGRLMLFPDVYESTPISTSIDDLCKTEGMQLMIGEYGKNPVQSTFTQDGMQEALKLVLNLCIYLECMNSPDEQIVVNTKPEMNSHSLDERVISKSCDFYSVLLDYRILTNEEKSLLKSDPIVRAAYKEMGFHWRRAHKRFRPGMKDVPGAKKTVPVKAARVRADKEPVNGLAAGARHVLAKK